MKHYHYIFTGSGLAALLTIYEMIKSKQFQDKSILLIDLDTKKTNDRTWCFWEKEKGSFEHLVSKTWNTAIFANQNFRRDLDLYPYQYKMIRGLDFYNYILGKISTCENITFSKQKVVDFTDFEQHVLVKTFTESFEESYTCNKLFNSIYNPKYAKIQFKYPLLQQHFIGWFIKSKDPVFTLDKVTFMDFSIPQNGNTKFMYVLPISSTEALLEPTLFSHQLLEKEMYETAIQDYAKNLGITSFEIIEKEQGSIPMTCYPFWKKNTKNILNIGSAGGWTKASTGYTFKHSAKKSKQLIQFLSKKDSDFRQFHKKTKFWFYDLLLLDVLDKNNVLGGMIFGAIFKKGSPKLAFKFLDEETTFLEDLQVMLRCPKMPFIKALLRRVF